MRLLEKELYDLSQTRIKNGNFSSAISSLETLESRFPFGRYAEQAQAELIYVYYRNFEFEAARSSAERFINLHPRHPHTGYAYYLRGISAFTDDSGLFSKYFESDLSKRDIEPAQRSFEDLSEFLSRYPDSPHASHAKQRMIYLKNLLAQHEIYVADWGNNRVVKFSPEGDFLREYGSFGSDAGELNAPASVCVDGEGYLYIADWGNQRLHVFDSEGRFLEVQRGEADLNPWSIEYLSSQDDERMARESFIPVYEPDTEDPSEISARMEPYLWDPVSVQLDEEGRVYVLETGRHRFQIFEKA